MKSTILITFITIFSTWHIGIPPDAAAKTPLFGESAVSRAKVVQSLHEYDLMSRPGIQGVGVGEKDGKLGIMILVDEQSRELEVPSTIEDMPVIVREVGQIRAHQINLGISGGNNITCPASIPGFIICDVGTVGFKVCDNTTSIVGGWISNNHVVVSGCTGIPDEKCPNMAPPGTNMFSPGLVDNTPQCSTTGAANVGTLNRFVTLVLDGPVGTNNLVDAAFVQSTDAQVSDNIQSLGPQSNAVAAPFLGQAVCKSGRTTGLTCGSVTGINLTLEVGYDTCGTATFINQVMYSPTAPYTAMSEPGDSGSPVVDSANNAVALNFAGDDVGNGFGNPMGTVLTQLEVSLCSDIQENIQELINASFETGPRIPAPWKGSKSLIRKDKRVDDKAKDGQYSFKILGNGKKKYIKQVIKKSGSTGDTFTLEGWSKAKRVPRSGGPYKMVVKVLKNGSKVARFKKNFSKGTHPWEYKEKSYSIGADYDKVVVFLLYGRGSGKVWYDDIRLTIE